MIPYSLLVQKLKAFGGNEQLFEAFREAYGELDTRKRNIRDFGNAVIDAKGGGLLDVVKQVHGGVGSPINDKPPEWFPPDDFLVHTYVVMLRTGPVQAPTVRLFPFIVAFWLTLCFKNGSAGRFYARLIGTDGETGQVWLSDVRGPADLKNKIQFPG